MRKTTGLLALAAALLVACGRQAEPSSARMEMRAYEVPPETTHAVQRALIDSFTTGNNQYNGNVGVIAPGKLVVMAPANVQDSIAASLKQIVKMPAGSAGKPVQLNVHFWSVDALPGVGADNTPAALNDALAQSRVMLGEVHFSLHDQISGVAGTGQEVEQNWQNAAVPGEGVSDLRYTVSGSPDDLSMTFRYNTQTQTSGGNGIQVGYRNTGLSTTLPIKLGQTVILSQTPAANSDAASGATRLLLIRADAVK